MRRALVQPALACGYRFEDEALVDEMIRDVSRECGALPLLAFAASRLWEKRDQERGLLTREAYKEIGGVGGALAQHAEVTLERIGRKRIPLVRELFRNLVTSQGTRAVRERDELLSVFDSKSDTMGTRADAEDVVNALVDARLLSSYVQAGKSGDNQQLLEIVHESLLFAWPRLLQWRAQEADGAQIRDQLRLAAQLWRDRGRSEDLLWSGTTYRDFVVWRERYPGPLSANESAFAHASEQLVLRGRRRKRVATASLLVAATLVSVITFGLWRQSVSSLQRAEAETLRSEAGKLLAMAEREAERYPTAALAYAIKSLELTDTEPARLLALKIVQQGPVARIAKVASVSVPGFEHTPIDSIDFSPDGEWIAWAGMLRVEALDRRGQSRLMLGDYVMSGGGRTIKARFTPDSKALIANRNGDVRLWSIPDGAELYRGRTEPGVTSIVRTARDAFLFVTATPNRALAQTWPLPPGRPSLIGSFELTGPLAATAGAVAYVCNNGIHVRSLRNFGAGPRLIARTGKPPLTLALSPDATVVASADNKEIRFWSAASNSSDSIGVREAPAAVVGLNYSDSGKSLVAVSFSRGYPMYSVFDLTGPENLVPTLLAKGDTDIGGETALDPTGQWLATSHGTEVAFWPLAGPRGRVFELNQPAHVVEFAGDGSRVLTLNIDNSVLDRPLQGGTVRQVRPATARQSLVYMSPDPAGRRVALSGAGGQIEIVDLATGSSQSMPGVPSAALFLGKPAFSEDGRLLAVGVRRGRPDTFRLHLWNLETGETTTYGPFVESGTPTLGIDSVHFVGNDQIYASVSGKGIVAVDLRTGASRLISNVFGGLVLSRRGQFGFVTANVRGAQRQGDMPLTRIDFERGTSSRVSTHGSAVSAVALDPHDQWVATGSFDGTIRIGPVSGDDPHVLLSQEGGGMISSLSFSGDGRWIAASGEGFRLTVWPVPDLSKRPFHRRPLDSLLKALKTFTNLAAIPDSATPNGYKLEPGVFPGWANPPEW
jgi:WD40 repeat protein